MASLGFTDLPTELLDEIIQNAIPEGFRSLALTCRVLHQLCTPFIERYNHLHSQFYDFAYTEDRWDNSLAPYKPAAFNLIRRIADEPKVARYIRHANLDCDTYPRAWRPWNVPDIEDGGPIIELFENSPYLKEAGLDWREYYALIQEDFEQHIYSQHAATFLLTLLPNVESLHLPKRWVSTEKSDKLLSAIVRKAIAQRNAPLWNRPSLVQLTKFTAHNARPRCEFGLEKAIPFLALPNTRWFDCAGCLATNGASIAIASQDPYLSYGATLETAHLGGLRIDVAAMADFVKHTPRLRTLAYEYWPGEEDQDWDIGQFVTAIENEGGGFLEELLINIWSLDKPITPGNVPMRGFQRLRTLEFTLDMVMRILADASPQFSTCTTTETLTDQEVSKLQALTDNLVPASVSKLSLQVDHERQHDKALQIMFADFVARKDAWVPALEDIYLASYSGDTSAAYKEECLRLTTKTKEAGVVLHIGDISGEEAIIEDL
ncbi:hypothetical protein VPNG_04611 [Cytospora leucostoma]|uniref:F-box domain-containing protein n=1 Tax=Cytospora leucostoma TaxID=1230097 RepID=A0A423XCJ9_9PEZI|nr:hypothetical protein VPNG_04611 [Cytospora leucostoma]